MVAEQRETVQRIDADTNDIATNVSGAQRELLKYYASISSNRWLMLKVFGVLIVFVRRLLALTRRRLMTCLVFGFYTGVVILARLVRCRFDFFFVVIYSVDYEYFLSFPLDL